MTSATTNRPAGAMTSAARSTRFGDFSSVPGRHNSEDRIPQASGLGQTFGNGASWQASSGIWGSNNISSGFPKRDASRSRAAGRSARRGEMLTVTDGPTAADNDSFPDGPSGSGALAASSEADPWSGRTNGPWNAPDTTSPTLLNSGNASPTRVRTNMPAASQQTILELQSPYSSTRPAIGQGKSFPRSQPKSNLDPSSGSFSYPRKPSFGYVDADKENYNQDVAFSGEPPRTFRPDQIGSQNSSYLAISGAGSRDTSMPPSRASEPALSFGNAKGYGHTPASSIHSQRPSFSGVSGSFHQPSGSRYGNDIAAQVQEAGVRDKFSSGLGLRSVEQIGSVSQEYSVSPSHSNFDPQSYQSNGGALWNDNSKGFSPYAPEFNPPFAEQAYFTSRGVPRFGDRGSISPAGSDYRRGLESPKFYSATGTPSSDQVYRPGSRGPRIPPGPAELNQRLQNIHIGHPQAIFYTGGYQGQYPPPPYDYQPTNFRAGNMPYGYPMPIPPFPSAQVIPTRPAKEQDIGAGVRSVLLEEFRSNAKSNKRYDLKDIYNHVVEFSGDQHGSRFIQQKLETANSDEKEQIFREIQPNALQLMTDVFGNYVIQKMFEHGNQVQKRVLAEQLKNHVNEMSLQMYGCRVVQKALEHVLADQQAGLVKELHADVLKCVKDQNGNHVVQKAIERVPREHIQFIIDAFKTQVHILAAHPYGCRVIQRILEYCTAADQASILEELHQCANMLITDQYGNYVIQHVIAHGKPEDRAKLIKIVTAQVLPLSKHKFASNVVEKSIQYGTDEQRKAIVAQMTMMHSDGTTPLQLMMKDQYANYVIQKLLAQLRGEERDAFIEDMKPQLISLKKFSYGKQIAAIEKLIFVTPQPYMAPTSPLTEDLMKRNIPTESDQLGSQQTQTQPIEIGSSAPTPSLTMGQNSPQSSSLPSTNVSTVDGPTDGSTDSDKTYTNPQGCPEVVINGV